MQDICVERIGALTGFLTRTNAGETNSARVHRIATARLEATPVDQGSLGGVDASFNNLGETLYEE